MKTSSSTSHALVGVLRNPVQALLVGLLRFYQVVVSPSLPSRCKYYPSCSHYALDAVREYGAFRGFVLAAWRVLRCNPLSYGGYDPVSKQKLFRQRPGLQAEGSLSAPAVDHPAEPDRATPVVCRHGHGHLVRG